VRPPPALPGHESWAVRNSRRPSRDGPPVAQGLARGAPAGAIAAVLWSTLALVSCGGDVAPVPPARPYADPGFADIGAYRLHYALTPVRDLPSEIARSYGIRQRPDLALLTIAAAPRAGLARAPADELELEATAVSLTGRRTPLTLERREEPTGPTWLATVEIAHRMPITIEIRPRGAGAAAVALIRFTREFRLE
jgi:Domain of unknown function (DUF4426)